MDTENMYEGNFGPNPDHHESSTAVPASSQKTQLSDAMEVEDNRSAEEDEEDEEDVMEDDFSMLMRAWTNERSAPDILEYEGATIENLMELVDFQLQKMKSQPALVANILKMDVDRVKYLVRSYLRTRLSKIEQHARHYVNEPTYSERLSQNELDYAKGFIGLEEKHVRKSFLDQLPPHLRTVDEVSGEGLEMVTKPDLDSAVFCRVRSTVGEFQFEASEDPIAMKRNNVFITRYSIICNLLEDGKVELL
ncbi:GINS complex subunit [Coemansia spiralis]|uniref:DNA replication complex GINS protein SLD5 n=2 Tax=Coemansia TaxID=4863 RepID=A0A9W8FYM2_9FUNG|nr:hypothetical protein BX070DRAFT_222257 [Coemansia spiralis]KAJ1988229.1 GINS complex subunit [Coemansia umbellata]KAJ2619622.1 GINS complex subunit [Coemansia sp. RSA 1358]KAJ2671596.1 GINS complex subunit [Coemansia spiralis]